MTSTVVVMKGGEWRTIKQREGRRKNWGKVAGAGATTAGIGSTIVGLAHQTPGQMIDRKVYSSAKQAGKKFPFVRAHMATGKGQLRLVGLGTGIAGIGVMGAGGAGVLHENRKISQRRKANAARANERSNLHHELRTKGVRRGNHIFMERLGPDGEIMQQNTGYKYKGDKITKAAPMSPAQRDQHRLKQVEGKKRQAQFGLANNAFGAAAGAIGTKAVWDSAKRSAYPEKVEAAAARSQQKVAARQAARVAAGKPKLTVVGRAAGRLKKVTSKVPKKYAAPLAIGTAVGTQLVNAGMDAQSGAYFAGEAARLRKKQKKIETKIDRREAKVGKSYEQVYDVVILEKSWTGGRNLLAEDVSKRARRFDPEGDRQRRLGMYEGAGVAGALGFGGAGAALAVPGAKQGKEAWKALSLARRKELKGLGKKGLVPAALLGGAAASAGLGVAAHKRANSARNQRWT